MSSNQPNNPPVSRRSLTRNPVTEAGVILATGALASIIFILLVEFVGGRETPYLGILLYLGLPILFVLGLVLIPVGMLITRRRLRRPEAIAAGIAPARYPVLNLNDPGQRLAFGFFIFGTLAFSAFLSGLSYRAYGFMESTEFCGQLCHTVMSPEFTAFQSSPHARVTCATCHIGEGADWFVRSKLSGVRQVLAVTFNTYSRPIPAPIRDLRPARETCERCHWPDKFFGDQTVTRVRFVPDEANTEQRSIMTIKTGGGGLETGLPSGIHWHMNIKNRIVYIATDPERQQIPWVSLENPGEATTTFQARNSTLTPETIANAEKRVMDCMDCHNRPTHNFLSPDESLDRALNAGRIDRTIPYVKREGVRVLSQDYPSTEAAWRAIDQALTTFYRSEYPDTYVKKGAAIAKAVREIQQAYAVSIFPEMNVDFSTYADNIGHQRTPGCFRCHDGNHVSAEGKVIGQACTTCHTLPASVTEPGRGGATSS